MTTKSGHGGAKMMIGMAAMCLMCVAPLLLTAGVGSALLGTLAGGWWLVGGLALAAVCGVVWWRRRAAGQCETTPGDRAGEEVRETSGAGRR